MKYIAISLRSCSKSWPYILILNKASKSRRMESASGYQKPVLGSITSPLEAHRLKPIRQKTKKTVVSILNSEEVCVELLKECTSEGHVKEVLQVSSDGTTITVYSPNDGRGFPLADRPPLPTENNSRHSFDNVLEKYWQKYQYASRFIQLVRPKTPKITYFIRYATCTLMENSPSADFEVWFYGGAKIHKTEDVVHIIEKTEISYTLKNEDEFISLKEEVKIYMDHANEGHPTCLALESVISEEEKGSRSSSFFPIIVGENLVLLVHLKPYHHLLQTQATQRESRLSVNSAVFPTQTPVLCPSTVTVAGPGQTATTTGTNISSSLPRSAQLLKSVFVRNVGWVTQLTSVASVMMGHSWLSRQEYLPSVTHHQMVRQLGMEKVKNCLNTSNRNCNVFLPSF